MSRENATDFCNGCGGWKRITGREGALVGNTSRGHDTPVSLPVDADRSLRSISVTNGATGAAIARRIALGFPSTGTLPRRLDGTI